MRLRWGGWELGVKRVKGSERDWKAETILMEREGGGGLYLLGGRVLPERWRWRRPKSEKTVLDNMRCPGSTSSRGDTGCMRARADRGILKPVKV